MSRWDDDHIAISLIKRIDTSNIWNYLPSRTVQSKLRRAWRDCSEIRKTSHINVMSRWSFGGSISTKRCDGEGSNPSFFDGDCERDRRAVIFLKARWMWRYSYTLQYSCCISAVTIMIILLSWRSPLSQPSSRPIADDLIYQSSPAVFSSIRYEPYLNK